MKRETTIDGFGKRLARFRKATGLSQKELGEAINVSNRVISYYERESKYPPAHLIAPIAKTLGITTDELLGLTEVQMESENRNTTIWKKLKLVEQLPKKDQKAILHHVDLAIKTQKYIETTTEGQRQVNQKK